MENRPKNQEDLIDWIDALENLLIFNGKEDTKSILKNFLSYADNKGLLDENHRNLPFLNSISKDDETEYPGDWELEKKIRHYICFNYGNNLPSIITW